MVIRASSKPAVDALLADLSSRDTVAREAAIARLTIIGVRAVGRLITLARDRQAGSHARSAAFQALAGIGDPRGLEPALDALVEADTALTAGAITVARAFLDSPHGIEALDRLAAVVLDRTRQTADRMAAISALSDLRASTVKPLLSTLADDPDQTVAEAARLRLRQPSVDPVDQLAAAAQGSLGDDPVGLRQAVSVASADVPSATIHQIIERIRVREGGEPAGPVRAAWTAARAAAHGALARRGSTLALYDLRETIASAREPLAVEFLAAATDIGDTSCLEAIAAAYVRNTTAGGSADWWHRHLAEAFRAIVRREGVTRRHAAVRRIAARSKDALTALWPQG